MHLLLGTLMFAVCFAGWGLVGAFAPVLRERFHLSGSETALLAAAPVILGALARLPMGVLADRFGARRVFPALMVLVAVAVWLFPHADTLSAATIVALFIGLAGSAFSVGVSYVARWSPPDRQGTALGIYGLGNAGQSAIVFFGPLLAAQIGLAAVFRGTAGLLVAAAVAFALLAREAPGAKRPANVGETLRRVAREPVVWALAAFYFLTFGGFVAFSLYLPTLLRDEFRLSAADAGFRAAGFVALATVARPLGGMLADRIGGARVLAGVFLGIVPFALLLAWSDLIPFSVGALGCAFLLGIGNGAVFRLVSESFPRDAGTAAGIVGAVGGLGGFFPPLLLGVLRDRFGVVWPGFVLLAALAIVLGELNRRVFLRRQLSLEATLGPAWLRTMQRARAGAWATLVSGILAAAVVVGSRNLRNFDPALVVYTFAVIFSAWGVVYHYWVWLQKPPTRLYWRRGWELMRRRGVARSLGRTASAAATHLFAQTFIARRSWSRWAAHQLIFWGCLLAAAITFPLVFGWIHFGTPADSHDRYVTYLFGFPVASFALHTAWSWMIFHGLDLAAVLVLAGVAIALQRRLRDRGAQALQSFGRDFFPLVLLFAISVTGLALTVSTMFLRGAFYDFLALLHAITVIFGLLYLPFGKFFHVFQRPAQLGVKLYQRAGEEGEAASCARCGERFASRMQIDDLRGVLGEVGFDYTVPGAAGHWQAICPPCKRKSVGAALARMKGAP